MLGQIERRLVLAGFIAASAILLFVGWESYRNTKRFAEADAWQNHSYEVLNTLDETLTQLVDEETGQRGFLLTGDEAYLEPYRSAIKINAQTIEKLKNLTSDNPNQQRRIQIIEPLVERKLAELQRTIDLYNKRGATAANQLVEAGSGKHLMDEIRTLIAEMANEEKDLLKVRTHRMNESVTRSVRTILAATFLNVSLLILCFGLLSRELSERRRTQEALSKSEKWFSTALASIGDAVIATDMNGVVTFMNSVARSLTGWSQAEATGKPIDLVFDIENKETSRPVENPVKKVFREGKVVGLADHTLLLSKDGKEFDIEDSAAPILTDTGEGLGVVLVFRDITEKKKAELETQRQKELLQLILGSIADGVVVADTTGKFLLFNAAAEQIVGIGATDTLPGQWSDQYGAYLPDTLTPFPPNDLPLVRAMRGESVDATEVFIRNANVPDGRLLSNTGAPLRGEDGAIRGGVVVFHDITERKRAEEALRQSEQRYHLLFDSNPHPVWVYDLKTLAILAVNHAAVRNYGYSREEFLSLTIKDLRPPEDIPALLESAAKAPPDTESSGAWKHRKKDGTLIDVEITSHPLLYGGKDARLVVATDITKSRQAEAALRQSEERFRLLVEGVQDYAIFMLDPNGLVISWNSGAEHIKGYKATDIIGKHFSCFYSVTDLQAYKPQRELEIAKKEGRVVDEGWRVRKDGSRLWANVVITALRGEKGQLLGFSKVTRDMTERKRIEEALRASEEKFRNVAETAKDAIISADSHGHIIYVNHAAEQTFSYSSQEMVGQPLTLLMPERLRDPHLQGFSRFLKTGEAHVVGKTVELVGRRKDGTEFPLQLSLSAWTANEGTFFTGILSDITERKRAEEALVHAKEEAERASKFKDQFLSTMSHELRTPLNAVLGFSDLLADERYGSLNDRQQRYVEHIHTGGKHLLKLISDILDLSKIEAGRMELTRENMTVASAFAEALSALQPLADKKSQALLQQVEPNLHVDADSTRFKQVLVNLVGNAIKFTPEGGRIELAARQEDGKVRVEVRDNGPGIPPEQQQRIFEAFFRLSQTGSSTEGTGLGLAITARLVELHGSKLEIASKPGEGTCFYFSLPLVEATLDQSAQTSTAKPKAGKAPRILVIEDNVTTGQLIQSQLAGAGYETLRCEQPQRAAEMAAEHQPDAITLDLLMEPVHGLEVLLQLKNDRRTAKIPVVVVTIVDQPGIGTALGADEYLVKPVDRATLLAAVERCLRSRGTVAPPRYILVVEDDAPTREVIVQLLTALGHTVRSAADGSEARAIVAQSLPELVLLDLVLPNMSGFDLLAEWRSNPRTAELSVFVLTGKDLSKEEEKYIRAHAESLFLKQHSWRDPLIKQLERVVTSIPVVNS